MHIVANISESRRKDRFELLMCRNEQESNIDYGASWSSLSKCVLVDLKYLDRRNERT